MKCIFALVQTKAEDDDTAPAMAGAALIGEALTRLIKLKDPG